MLLLNGNIVVVRDLNVPFNAMRAPGIKPAAFVSHGVAGAWEFSDGTDDTIVAMMAFPDDMIRSIAPILHIGWSTNTAVTTETAVWQAKYLYEAVDEDTAAAAQDTKTVASNAVAQANGLIIANFAALDVVGGADVCMCLEIKRLGADGNDDLTDTAELHWLHLRYTAIVPDV